jgi:hypothetical protein
VLAHAAHQERSMVEEHTEVESRSWDLVLA